MDLELVKLINSDLSWSAVKKGHRSMTRRPRKTKATRDSVDFDYEKSGVAILGQHFSEEVHQVPIKKRILLLQSPDRSTQSEHVSDAIKLTEKAGHVKIDFFGIELLAAAACHTSVSGHVDSPAVEEHSTPTPIVESYPDGIKQDINPIVSDDSSIQDNMLLVPQNVCDNGNDQSPVPIKVSRLHWDLNTVMDEWEEPCDILVDHHSGKSHLQDVHSDDLQNETGKSQVTSGMPDDVSIQVKNYDVESGVSKSDVVDSLAKCENVSTSTASVSLEETTIKVESDDKQAVSEVVQGGCLSLKGDKLTSEDHLSDCCGSNVSQDKVKSGYDSPAEDGELREPPVAHIWEKEELEELECVDYESDNMYEDNSDAIESVTNEIVIDHPQPPVSIPNNEIKETDKEDALPFKHSQSVISVEKDSISKRFAPERKNMSCVDKPTSTSYIRRSGSERDFGQQEGSSYHGGQRVDSFSRNKHGSGGYSSTHPRLKTVRSGGSTSNDNNEAIHYNPRGIYGNESYDVHRDRSRVGLRRTPQKEYHNPEPERKAPFFASGFDRGANLSRSQKQSRVRSRSGSPIAWHFQKKQTVDRKRHSETEGGFVSQSTNSMSVQCVSRSFDDRNVINGQFRDRRSFHRTNQRHEPPEYHEKLKSNDRFRPRFSSNSSYSSIHDDKYGMMNERRRFRYDNDESFKGYSRNKDNGFRYNRVENKGYRDPDNTSEVKGCRYTTNRMFIAGEAHFHKDN